MPLTKRTGVRALQIWCQRATSSYQNVDIVDMTSSFKNGLAFCAIIHHYRPHLIDYASLKPENIFENNELAFRVAEEELDIPSLLDPEDMVEFEEPDKFSIVTYVSQFYHFFKSEDSPISSPSVGVVRGVFSRNSESSSENFSSSESTPTATPSATPKIGRVPSGYVHNKTLSQTKKTFNHQDLLAKYGEEIFENSSSKKVNTDGETKRNPSSKFGLNSLCSDMMVKATISEERES